MIEGKRVFRKVMHVHKVMSSVMMQEIHSSARAFVSETMSAAEPLHK